MEFEGVIDRGKEKGKFLLDLVKIMVLDIAGKKIFHLTDC